MTQEYTYQTFFIVHTDENDTLLVGTRITTDDIALVETYTTSMAKTITHASGFYYNVDSDELHYPSTVLPKLVAIAEDYLKTNKNLT